MILSKKQQKLWAVIVVISSLALIGMAFIPSLLYVR